MDIKLILLLFLIKINEIFKRNKFLNKIIILLVEYHLTNYHKKRNPN